MASPMRSEAGPDEVAGPRRGREGEPAMLKPDAASSEQHDYVLSNLPPSDAQKRLALGIVACLLTALYLVIGPFGGRQFAAVQSFVAVYTTAMFVIDAVTAILLYAQYSVLRSRAILVIASAYLFNALLIVPYVLAFPGVLAPRGVVGGMQTTAHLYLVWHCAFPLFVIGYALLKDKASDRRPAGEKFGAAVLHSVVWTTAGAAVVAVLCIQGRSGLPQIMLDDSRFVPNWLSVVGAPIAVLCSVALLVLWLRRRSILDLFLMVVLCAYLVEILPHWYPRPARFSTGWYAVRITSLISSGIVLVVLLYEITALYGALLRALLGQRREREARLATGDAVAASIAHEVRQPLTAMVTTADAGFRFLDRPTPNVLRAKEAFRRIAADGDRAGTLIGDIRANFKTRIRDRTAIDLDELIHESLGLADPELQAHRIIVSAEVDRAAAVRGNRGQLQQVLLNLIRNAADAMASTAHPRVMTIKADRLEDGRVAVSVADTGTGVASPDLDRVFNPLFTTKPDGMGMGLSICRAIVAAHDGQLSCAANAPRGAVFQFTLQGEDPTASTA
jgi:signal transduction histidine kinase